MCELAVLNALADIDEVLLGGNLNELVPVGGHLLHVVGIRIEGHHGEGLAKLGIARTDVGTVAAAEAVEHTGLNDKVHALHGGRRLHLKAIQTIKLSQLIVGKHKRTDGSVGTDVSALVALDTVLFIPQGHEGLYAALLIGSGAYVPRAVGGAMLYKVANLEQVASLSIDGAHELLNECRSVVSLLCLVRQIGPCRVNGKRLVFVAAVNGCVVFVNHVLSLGAIRLHDSFFHLLNGELHGDDACDAEESALQDGVGTIAKAYLLCYLGGVDGIDGDIVLCEVALDVVGHELGQLVALEDGVEQEGTILL